MRTSRSQQLNSINFFIDGTELYPGLQRGILLQLLQFLLGQSLGLLLQRPLIFGGIAGIVAVQRDIFQLGLSHACFQAISRQQSIHLLLEGLQRGRRIDCHFLMLVVMGLGAVGGKGCHRQQGNNHHQSEKDR